MCGVTWRWEYLTTSRWNFMAVEIFDSLEVGFMAVEIFDKHEVESELNRQAVLLEATGADRVTRGGRMGRSGYTCVRHIFCWLNVLMWLSGCGMLGVGLWLRFSYAGYTSLLPQYSLVSADSMCVAIGVIVFVVAFFGCCGSWFQSRCMLITYFSLVIFMFLVEFMFATLAFVFRENLGFTLRDELKTGIEQHYNTTAGNNLDKIWTHIHNEFHCCGVTNYEDWYAISAWPNSKFVPDSCCLPKFSNITGCGQSGDSEMWYSNGCAEQVQMWFVERLHIVGIVGLVVAFVQLFGLISSMLLFCTVRHKRTSHTYKSYDPHS